MAGPPKGSRSAPGPSPADAGSTLVVHELKNLAGRLALLCQNLAERYDEPLFRTTALDVLNLTAGQLRQLANDLREREGRILVKLRVDLNVMLDTALAELAPEARGDLRVEAEYGDLPPLWGDGFLLQRAFACAIDNAVEAMNGRGILRVSTKLARRAGRPVAVVDIEDSGPGMSAEFVREMLFRPFGTTKSDGLGLGAYTIRQVALVHGGRVQVRSVEGAGTRVRFRFPYE